MLHFTFWFNNPLSSVDWIVIFETEFTLFFILQFDSIPHIISYSILLSAMSVNLNIFFLHCLILNLHLWNISCFTIVSKFKYFQYKTKFWKQIIGIQTDVLWVWSPIINITNILMHFFFQKAICKQNLFLP